MKKWCIILAMVVTLIQFASPATSEENNLTEYSDQELVVLLGQVQQEIINRGIEKTALLTKGTYIGGQAIPIGSYLICGANPGDRGYIDLRYPLNEQGQKPVKMTTVWKEDDTEPLHITIEEGDILTIEIPCNLTISGGLVFQ